MKSHLILHSTNDMNKQQWLDFRKNGIGGSESGTVLGLNKYMSSIELFYYKIMFPSEKPENEAMHWGNALEDLIADRWQYWDDSPQSMIKNFNEKKIIRRCRRMNAYITNPAYPNLFASVDRIINKNNSDMESVLECKTIAGYVIDQWENGIPPAYVVQLQQYLLVPELNNGEIAMLKDGRYMEVMPFEKNDVICNELLDKTNIFWQRVTNARDVLSKHGIEYYSDDLPMEIKQAISEHEPDPDGSIAYESFLKARFKGESPERSGTEIEYQMAVEYDKLNDALKSIEEQKREYGNRLMKSIGDSESINFGKERGKITWRPNKHGTRTFRCSVK